MTDVFRHFPPLSLGTGFAGSPIARAGLDLEAPPSNVDVSSPTFHPRSLSPVVASPETREIDVLTPTIFHEPWWLEISTRGRFECAEVRVDGRVAGRLPYFRCKFRGQLVSYMPELTHFLGPAIDDGTGSEPTRHLRRLGITRELIAKLPNFATFEQKLHRGITDTLAFQIDGFRTGVQFTYEIGPQPEEKLWSQMRDKTRNMIRKATKEFRTETILDPELFLHLYRSNVESRGLKNKLDLAICQDIITAALDRNVADLHVARRNDGTIASAILCVRDQTSSYYLMSTRQEGNNSANPLLVWEAIKDASRRGLIFDFDGVSSAGAVLFYAGFGAPARPRYNVVRRSKLQTIFKCARDVLWREPYFFHG